MRDCRAPASPAGDHAPPDSLVNCTHPQFILDTYPAGTLGRLIGIQANASSKDVTQLDNSSVTEADPLDDWAAAMLELHRRHGVKILGGCCGTSLPQLRALVGVASS